MPNGGVLQYEWPNTLTSTTPLIIDTKTWALDLCKPLVYDNNNMAKFVQ
jgi:hypothetical protein